MTNPDPGASPRDDGGSRTAAKDKEKPKQNPKEAKP